jgi:membrane associated rhomboid family serine protease
MFLWVFGSNIEGRLGHIKYLLFYLVTGAAATLTHWLVDPASPIPLVGASGAIAGVMGAYLLLYPRNRINTIIIFFFITVVRLSATLLLGFWFLWQLIQAVLSIGVSGQVSVAFWAHVGGFVVGAGIIASYKLLTGQPLRPPKPPPSSPSSVGTKFWRGRRLD